MTEYSIIKISIRNSRTLATERVTLSQEGAELTKDLVFKLLTRGAKLFGHGWEESEFVVTDISVTPDLERMNRIAAFTEKPGTPTVPPTHMREA